MAVGPPRRGSGFAYISIIMQRVSSLVREYEYSTVPSSEATSSVNSTTVALNRSRFSGAIAVNVAMILIISVTLRSARSPVTARAGCE